MQSHTINDNENKAEDSFETFELVPLKKPPQKHEPSISVHIINYENEEKMPLLAARTTQYATFDLDEIKEPLLNKQIKQLQKKKDLKNKAIFINKYGTCIGVVIFIGASSAFIWYSWDMLKEFNAKILSCDQAVQNIRVLYQNASCPLRDSRFFYHPEGDYIWYEDDYFKTQHIHAFRVLEDYCVDSDFARSIINSITPSACAAIVFGICNHLSDLNAAINDRGTFYLLFFALSLWLSVGCPTITYHCFDSHGEIDKREIKTKAEGLALTLPETINDDRVLDIFVADRTRIENKKIRHAVLSFFNANNIAIQERDTARIIFDYANISASQARPLSRARRNTQ